jgi:hypothetical protein
MYLNRQLVVRLGNLDSAARELIDSEEVPPHLAVLCVQVRAEIRSLVAEQRDLPRVQQPKTA